jgi:hypothetical protein
MALFVHVIIFFLSISSCLCANNLTYVLSNTNTTSITSFLRVPNLILINSSYVKRLSSSSNDLVISLQYLLTSNNIQSIVFAWNTGDCSYPLSMATYLSNRFILSPICLTQTSTLTNLIQLTVTSEQLAQAAGLFMARFSLHYFTMIVTDANNFYFGLAESFANQLTKLSFIYEHFMFTSNLSITRISSLKSRRKSFVFVLLEDADLLDSIYECTFI